MVAVGDYDHDGYQDLFVGGQAQYNQVSFAAGYASSSAGPMHFGLGANRQVERAEIRRPSGITQVVQNVMADRVVRVREAAQ